MKVVINEIRTFISIFMHLCCRTEIVFTFHIKYEILYIIIMFLLLTSSRVIIYHATIILVWFSYTISIYARNVSGNKQF